MDGVILLFQNVSNSYIVVLGQYLSTFAAAHICLNVVGAQLHSIIVGRYCLLGEHGTPV